MVDPVLPSTAHSLLLFRNGAQVTSYPKGFGKGGRALGVVFLLLLLLLAGCATNLQGGVGPLASPKAAQIVDLVQELYERAGKQNELCPTKNVRSLELIEANAIESRQWKSSNIPNSASEETRCLTQAHVALEKHLRDDPMRAAEVRNSLQDRLMTASDQSCALYKKYLNANQSSTNFLLGSTTLTLAAFATNVTSTVAAKNYTTGALIGSGLSAEFNADMFNSQMIFAIVKAIDVERQRALQKIQTERSLKTISDYGISAAIGDALRYHEICSLPAGLAAMDKSVTVMHDPGLKHIAAMFPSGKLTVKDGVITAENLAPIQGDNSHSTNPVGLGLPVLANVRFARAVETLKNSIETKKSNLKTKPEKNNEEKKKIVEKIKVLDSAGNSDECKWEKNTSRKVLVLVGVGSQKLCQPDVYLEQVCNNLDHGLCDENKGMKLSKILARALYDSYHAWELETKIDPTSPSVSGKRAAYEIALASHQAYINFWLQPAIDHYEAELDKFVKQDIETGKQQGN